MSDQTIIASTDDDLIAAAAAERDRTVLDMVREALELDRVMLAYQPVVGSVTGQVAFHEGLIRLRDATGRIIPAGQFIEAVETNELGREIDCAALRLGLAALAGKPDLRLSINMSARSIGYARWTQTLTHGLAHAPSVGERLILEITERSAMQIPELVKAFMADLQDQGITFALDDFGAGQTSFRHLKEFYFDILKIDGNFVRNCDTDPDNQCIVNALITVGQQFDMFIVAEAVETAAEAQFLVAAGADCLQGYYYGAPQVNPAWLKGRSTGMQEAG
ncbi:EAL domain, c-di-GMP-specific phosphodiesterase class I (or its enzymatically inactive variant) [Jannaschia faecimaris]|uniref:EAL domain, c-di-GMP-specific phosphodiesterase class I (Or its enzymatically inactive variant) n=1 Tax=Jannaschia faecimaris TaxID=1244108 RepID=A0A1H3LT63_9RHOB|nr:EAL domain-containing protein [Jannaschia faecimaris]SDY67622.1 EAL domain, c-di-GMP-specific phosphodiesterase class I (or its enzymatically inactive variant) [Jannaschia faecimaris]